MCSRQKTLLAAVIVSALCCKVAAEELGMAPDAVDDLYAGCEKQALNVFITSGLLRQELNHSRGFQRAWNTKCSHLNPGGTKEHTAALMVFANEDNVKFQTAFNDAVEMYGKNASTYEDFSFKALHFLLMDSMSQQKCTNVYKYLEEDYIVEKGSRVRFGRFTTATRDTSQDISEPTVFNITTCFYANLSICENDEDRVLLSPSEQFTVEDVIKRTDYTEILLKQPRLVVSHNCYYFSRSPADVSPLWLVLLLMGFSLFFCSS